MPWVPVYQLPSTGCLTSRASGRNNCIHLADLVLAKTEFGLMPGSGSIDRSITDTDRLTGSEDGHRNARQDYKSRRQLLNRFSRSVHLAVPEALVVDSAPYL